jgi:hypothetical protein
VNAVSLGEVLGEMVFEIHYAVGGASKVVLATASNGELRVPLTRTQALQLAQQDFSLPIAASSVDYIEAVASDDEYRGYPLPAWRVSFADDRNSRIYISAELAKVTARRNDVWRIFDLMWALHILDFEQRENFNTLLLQTLAWLGVVTIISGFVLWLMTTSLFRSRR